VHNFARAFSSAGFRSVFDQSFSRKREAGARSSRRIVFADAAFAAPARWPRPVSNRLSPGVSNRELLAHQGSCAPWVLSSVALPDGRACAFRTHGPRGFSSPRAM
jgi:hypothetical protein